MCDDDDDANNRHFFVVCADVGRTLDNIGQEIIEVNEMEL